MPRETVYSASTVVVVLDGDTEAGYQLALRLLAGGRRVAVIGRRTASLVRAMHGQPSERILAIAGDVDDRRQWTRIMERVTERFGRVDTIVRAEARMLRATA